jgi:sulfide dehydrogenase [flavocytochrome c] flavoprotein chain
VGVRRRREFLHCAAGALAAAALRRSATAAGAARIVIVGGGFGGGHCALQLRRLCPAATVTLIDADSRYSTCPMSDGVIVGMRTLASITTARPGLERSGVQVVRGRVQHIDGTLRKLRLQEGAVIGYDRLVIAPGIRLLYGTPAGYDEQASHRLPHAWQAGTQTALLAAQLRAMPDGGTVAISVPAGLIRCPPGPYERASLIADWMKRNRPRSKLLVFDANNHFPRQDVFTTAWQELYPGLIDWIPPGEGGAITHIDARTRTLYSSSGAHRVDVANIIPPQAPAAVALDAGLSAGHGWCPVKPSNFASEHLPAVYVIGDACIAGAMPKTASAARSQAERCAAGITAELAGYAPPVSELQSVCYSMVAPGSALAMRARFEVVDGEIRALSVTVPAGETTPSAQHASEGDAWYAQMRSACFGD